MRKTISILIALLTLIQLSSCSFLDELVKVPDEDSIEYDNMGGGWVMDECHMVDYEIIGDQITFEYSLCYYYDDEDRKEILENIVMSFNNSDLKGWMKNKFLGFLGKDENGDIKDVTVNPYEKNYFTLFFTGEYLGGEVNTKIKPTRIDYSLGSTSSLADIEYYIGNKVNCAPSPDKRYIVNLYRDIDTNGGAIGELVDVEKDESSIIYWDFYEDGDDLEWTDNTHIKICGRLMDVTKDTYDFRVDD